MKHTIKGFIVYRTENYWDDNERVQFRRYDPREDEKETAVFVCEHSFDVEVPDDFDPRPRQVAMLVAAKAKVRAEFAKRITELDTQINKLLALENTSEA